MPEVIARLDRWADGLPVPCDIPISADEAFEVATYEDEQFGQANGYRLGNILDRIVGGKYLYRGHRVVVQGGKARAESLSARKRKAIAKKAAEARWGKH